MRHNTIPCTAPCAATASRNASAGPSGTIASAMTRQNSAKPHIAGEKSAQQADRGRRALLGVGKHRKNSEGDREGRESAAQAPPEAIGKRGQRGDERERRRAPRTPRPAPSPGRTA